jgi:putative resolvase
LVPVRIEGNQRRYELVTLQPELHHDAQALYRTIALCPGIESRVESRSRTPEAGTGIVMRALYCASQGWKFEVIAIFDSGMNYQLIDAVRQAVKEAQ